MKNCVIMKKIKTNHCNQSKNQPIKPITSIDCLPDECLFLIFQELSLYEAVNIERVCKRWRNVSLKVWSLLKKITIVQRNDAAAKKLPGLHLGALLQRTGNHVTEIKICGGGNGAGKLDPNKAFPVFSKYCKQLQHLEFSYCFGRQEVNLRKLSFSLAKNLKGLYFLNNCKINKASLVAFLKKAVNLENLYLDSCHNVTNDALLNLSSKCKDLNLQSCKLNKHNYSIKLFQKLPELKYLDVSRTNILPEALFSISEHLVSLTLKGSASKFFEGNNYKNLLMPNLVTLDVRWNLAVTDEVVSYFHTCFPSLGELYLEGCENVNFGFSCRLEECKRIKDLYLNETNIADFDFIHLVTHMPALESLGADCDDLTESGLIMAVSSLPKLTFIFIGETLKISEKFFKDALRFVKTRPDNISLEIAIDCLEKNAKKLKQIVKDEITRLKLVKKENIPSTAKNCVVTFRDDKWYVDSE